ncbi:DUF4230 domain-containing protein [bacterium]|nr:DUF4230 domain-containing protein [bacterium]
MTRDERQGITDLPPEEDYIYEVIEEDASSPPDQRRRGGCGWGLAGLTGCLGMPLLLIALALFMGVTSVSGFFDGLADLFRGSPAQATITTTRTIVTALETRGTLETVSVGLARTNVRVSVREGFQNACGYSANHAVEGTVEAGVDLSSITPDDVTYDPWTETWIITLPAPVLTSCRIDFIQQYDRSLTYCGITWDNARQLAQFTSIVDFRDEALEADILTRAGREALPTIRGLLTSFTDANIEIRYADPDPDMPFPASCDPLPPPGWTYNPDNNTWTN